MSCGLMAGSVTANIRRMPANPDTGVGTTATIMWYLQSLMNSGQYDIYGMVSAMGLTLGVFIGCITGIQLFLTRERKSGTKLARAFAAYKAEKAEKASEPVPAVREEANGNE